MADEEENNHIDHLDDHTKISVLAERQRRLAKRVTDVETVQKEGMSLMNKIVGGITFLVAAGLFVGWLFTIFSGMQFFR